MIQRRHEGNVEDRPFEDESFDVVLSIFGHMFALHPEIALKEMLRVTKSGGCIGFTIWPAAELLNGKMFEAIAKHMTSVPLSPSNNNSPRHHNHILQCNVEIQKSYRRLDINDNVKDIHFEEGVDKMPLSSPNHYWKMLSTKFGPIIKTIQTLKDTQKIKSLKKDILKAIMPHFHDNILKLDYLITVTKKE